MIKPGSAPRLPDGFKEAHDLKNKELTDAGFVSKDKYLELLAAQRAATKPFSTPSRRPIWMTRATARCRPWAPTVGAALLMAGMHSLNHSGQFVAVRRMLKKPIAF